MGFFDQYKNYEYKKKLKVIVPAFLIALGLNTVLFTETGHRMQSSIVSYEGIENSHMSVVVDPGTASGSVRVHQDMQDIKTIHFTLLYDDSAVILDEISAMTGGSLIELSDSMPRTISVSFAQETDLVANTDIVSFGVASITTEPRTINISDTFFMSGGNRYELTNQGSGPF